MELPQPPLWQRLRAGGHRQQQRHRGQGKRVPWGLWGRVSLPGDDPCNETWGGTLGDISLASSLLLGCPGESQLVQGLGHQAATSLPIPTCAASFHWCFPFQKGYFVTMKVLYTCGYSTSLAALILAIGIFSCFR